MAESQQITRDIMVALIEKGGITDVSQLTNTYRQVFEVVHESCSVYSETDRHLKTFMNKDLV